MSDDIYRLLEHQLLHKVIRRIVRSMEKSDGSITESCIQQVKSLHQEADIIRDKLIHSLPAERRIETENACKKGCGLCCRLKVLALIPELHLLADFVRKTSREKTFQKIHQKLRQNVARIATAKNNKDGKLYYVECAFLEEGACSVYEARPFSCRAWNSTDYKMCETYMQGEDVAIPTSIVYHAPHLVIRKGIMLGLKECGYETTIKELNAGLLSLLEKKL